MNLCDWKQGMARHSPNITKLYERGGKKYCYNHFKIIDYSLYVSGMTDTQSTLNNTKIHKLEQTSESIKTNEIFSTGVNDKQIFVKPKENFDQEEWPPLPGTHNVSSLPSITMKNSQKVWNIKSVPPSVVDKDQSQKPAVPIQIMEPYAKCLSKEERISPPSEEDGLRRYKECHYKGCTSTNVKGIHQGLFCDDHDMEIQIYRDALNQNTDIYSQLNIRTLEQDKRKYPHPLFQKEIDTLRLKLISIESAFINNMFRNIPIK